MLDTDRQREGETGKQALPLSLAYRAESQSRGQGKGVVRIMLLLVSSLLPWPSLGDRISKAGFEILNDMNDAGMEYEHGTTLGPGSTNR